VLRLIDNLPREDLDMMLSLASISFKVFPNTHSICFITLYEKSTC
jgi:hypothetical protein